MLRSYLIAAALCALALLPARAAPKTARLALIEDSPYILSLRLAVPLEKLLAARGPRAELIFVEQLACETAPGVYRCPLTGPGADSPPLSPRPARQSAGKSRLCCPGQSRGWARPAPTIATAR